MSFLDAIQATLAKLGGRGAPAAEDAAEAARQAQAEALVRQAHVALLDGAKACAAQEYVAGMHAFQQAFIAFTQAGHRDDASLTQKIIGLLFIHIKDDDQVRRACVNARGALEAAGMRDEAARILMFLGDFESDRGEFKSAAQAFKTAVHLCRTITYVDGEVDSLCRYGVSEAKRGKPAEARNLMGQAKAAAERHKRGDLIEHVDGQAEQIVALAAPMLMGGGGSGNRRF